MRSKIARSIRNTVEDGPSPSGSKHIFFVDDLPRNPAGRILKRELYTSFAAEVEGESTEDPTITVEGSR